MSKRCMNLLPFVVLYLLYVCITGAFACDNLQSAFPAFPPVSSASPIIRPVYLYRSCNINITICLDSSYEKNEALAVTFKWQGPDTLRA